MTKEKSLIIELTANMPGSIIRFYDDGTYVLGWNDRRDQDQTHRWKIVGDDLYVRLYDKPEWTRVTGTNESDRRIKNALLTCVAFEQEVLKTK